MPTSDYSNQGDVINSGSDSESMPDEVPILKDTSFQPTSSTIEKRKKKSITKKPFRIFGTEENSDIKIQRNQGSTAEVPNQKAVQNHTVDDYYGVYKMSHGIKAVSIKSMEKSRANASSCAFVNALASKYDGVTRKQKKKFLSNLSMSGKVDSRAVMKADLKKLRQDNGSEIDGERSARRIPTSANCPKFV